MLVQFFIFYFSSFGDQNANKKKNSNLGFQNFVKWKLFFQKFKMGR